MLMRADAFRDVDRLGRHLLETAARPAVMPMDAYRTGEEFVVHFDLPGADPESIDLDVERNVLTVRAERRSPTPQDAEVVASERPAGTYTRRLLLGDSLDVERIEASYDAGVLTLRLPLAEKAKPRRIKVNGGPAGAAPRRITA
ncbi:Hsp20/alpha crystallin family protein [Streptomyces sp. NPDC050856]|uniref:Hsp20/alpha crystallin family protein n=1 Tax=Streptomyces sp. NPDC050856 TaxID=3154939 RepID=UPI00340E288A